MARRAEVILGITPDTAGWRTFVAGAERDIQHLQSQASQIGRGMAGGTGGGGGRIGGTSIPPGGGFFDSFMSGFGRAGGFGSALATVIKYGAAYKAVEMGLGALMAPLRATEAAVRSSIKSWADYEEQMAKASRTFEQSGMSTKTLKGVLGADALDFITKYRVSMEEAAKAQYELGSAGFSASKVLQTYTVPLKLAIGLQGDVTETTRVLTQMLKIHGDQMGKNMTDYEKMTLIAGLVAKTWQQEQFELSDLTASYKYIAGTAGTLNLKLEQLIPLLGMVSTYGSRGSTSGTGLNQMFVQLARNATVSNGQITEINKKLRGSEITMKMPAGTKNIMDVVTQFGLAMQKFRGSEADLVKFTRVVMDVLNIRGGRQGAIVFGHLAEAISKVGDASKMTVKDADAFLNKLVEIMQSTPQGQMDLIRSNIYSLGANFVVAAAGGNTLVDALKNIVHWLQQVAPGVEKLGRNIRTTIAGALAYQDVISGSDKGFMERNIPLLGGLHKMMRATAAKNKAGEQSEQQSLIERAASAYGTGYLETGTVEGARRAVAKLIAPDEAVLREIQKNPPIPQVTRTMEEQKRPYVLLGQSIGKIRDRYLPGAGANVPQTKWEKDVVNEALARKKAGSMLDEYNKLMQGVNAPSITPTGGGGHGGGGTKPKTAQEKAQELARFISENNRARVKMSEFGLDSFTVQQEMASLMDMILGKGPYGALPRIDRAGYLDTWQQRAYQEKSKAEKGADFKASIAAREQANVLAPFSQAREVLERKTSRATAIEGVYGATIASTTEKMKANQALLSVTIAEREKLQGFLSAATRRNQEAETALSLLTGPKSTASTEQKEAALKKVKETGDALENLDSKVKAADQTIWTLENATIPGLNKEIGEFVPEALKKATEAAEKNRETFAALGTTYEDSNQALRDNAEIMKAGGDVSKYSALNIGIIIRRLKEQANAAAEAAEKQTALNEATADVQTRTKEMQLGWQVGMGGPLGRAAQRQLDDMRIAAETSAMGKQGIPQAVIDDYKKVATANSIIQPWIEAKNRIQDEWTSMFQDVFAALASGANPFKALDSIFKSIQGQMISGWVKSNFGGLFDMLASKETGIQGASGGVGAGIAALGISIGTQAGTKIVDKIEENANAIAAGGSRRSSGVKVGNDLITGMQNYSIGSMFAGMAGSAMGYDAQSSGVAGGLGYAAGLALGLGPIGAIATGLLGILGFGKKKAKPAANDPTREMYGMPAFEYQSYLFNLYKDTKDLSAYNLGSLSGNMVSDNGSLYVNTSGGARGSVTININGGDTEQVSKVVRQVIRQELGPTVQASVGGRAFAS